METNFESFEAATNLFLESASWLEDSDAPAIHALRKTAWSLDLNMKSPLLQQYRYFYQQLLNKRPDNNDPESESPIAAFFKQRDGTVTEPAGV